MTGGTGRFKFGLAMFCGAIFAWCVLFGVAPAWAQQDGQTVAAGRQIFDLTNQDRKAQGLQSLQWNDALAAAAQRHADLMVTQGQLSHQYPGEPELMQRCAQAGAHFQAIAENLAQAPNAEAVEQAWRVVDPIAGVTEVFGYEPGSWGPPEAALIQPEGGWSDPT